jgi:hypothetical protein
LTYFYVKQFPVLPPSTFSQPCPWSGVDLRLAAANSPPPIPTSLSAWLLPRVLELTYTAWDLEPFARDVVAGVGNGELGVGNEGLSAYIERFAARDSSFPTPHSLPPFIWNEERRFLLRAELDAAFFHLYLGSGEWGVGNREGTGRQSGPDSQLPIPDSLREAFPTPRDAVSYIMDTFPIVRRKDEEKYNGDYRTKRVILEIYDALLEAIRTGHPYQTRLDPPPADPRVAHPTREDQPNRG